jgi:uncharacterized repeat protein (TIGR03803 family)
MFATSAAAQTEKVLHSFLNNSTDGGSPYSALIFDKLGNLYGTASIGGSHGGGIVFELVPSARGWTETVIYNFNASSSDGNSPIAGLIMDKAGNLYGTTYYGGAQGAGTAFELVPRAGGTWTEAVLHSFSGGTDGANPNASLIFDARGNLYGTTVNGGPDDVGTVFELVAKPTGGVAEKILHSFNADGVDGNHPYANLVFDASGNLYSTTYDGGDSVPYCRIGCGIIFQLSPAAGGVWTENLYTFYTCFNGCAFQMVGGLALDTHGNLVGASSYGYWGGVCPSSYYTCGTVFELTPPGINSWTYTDLYNFVADGSDGVNPMFVTPVLDKTGNIYGTTFNGGANSVGTVFEVSPQEGQSWTEQILYSFSSGGSDGQTPMSSLVMDGHGNLYGTTLSGGTGAAGTVFEIIP